MAQQTISHMPSARCVARDSRTFAEDTPLARATNVLDIHCVGSFGQPQGHHQKPVSPSLINISHHHISNMFSLVMIVTVSPLSPRLLVDMTCDDNDIVAARCESHTFSGRRSPNVSVTSSQSFQMRKGPRPRSPASDRGSRSSKI